MRILDHRIKIGNFSKEFEDFKLSASITQANDFKVEFSLKNISKASKFVGDVTLGEFDSSETLFMNNFQSWGPCTFAKPKGIFTSIRNRDFPGGFMMSPIPWEFKNGVVSDYFIATDKEFAGFLSSKVVHPYFLWQNGIIKIKVYVGKELKPGEKIELETLWLTKYESLEETLDEYAKKVADFNKPKIENPIFGWSSWYHYYLDISQESFIKEIELSKTLSLNYELFQLDDGYEADIGDWLETNEKFPDGLESLAKKVKESGMISGIWTAPFSISESSKLFRDHPDWIVKNESGEPLLAYENWNRKIYALDTTNPDAQRWLEDTFSTLKNYGFDFFKIDFLFAAIIPGRRHLNVTPVEAYRMGMKTIRKAAGNSHVLGCGAPLLPSIGYVNSMRIGSDTAPYWTSEYDFGQPSAKHSIRNALARNFINGVWWTNDPDCVMARSNDTKLNDDERMVNVYIPALLNGHFLQSDKLSSLSKEDVYLLKSALNFRDGKSHVKFIDGERYVIISERSVNGDVLSFVNLSNSIWNVKMEDFSNLLSVKEDEFFISYPSMRETKPEQKSVKPHSILMILHRGKRQMIREDEKKKDGRDFHYYTSRGDK